jgi:hypothetical protein
VVKLCRNPRLRSRRRDVLIQPEHVIRIVLPLEGGEPRIRRSGCYGSLTSFNVLFADADDQFKGSGGESS